MSAWVTHSKGNSIEMNTEFKHTNLFHLEPNKAKLKWWCVWKRSLILFNSDKPSTQWRKNSAHGWFAQACFLCSCVFRISCRQWGAWPKWQLVGFFWHHCAWQCQLLYQCPISPQLLSEKQTSSICIIVSFAASFIKNNEPLCTSSKQARAQLTSITWEGQEKWASRLVCSAEGQSNMHCLPGADSLPHPPLGFPELRLPGGNMILLHPALSFSSWLLNAKYLAWYLSTLQQILSPPFPESFSQRTWPQVTIKR